MKKILGLVLELNPPHNGHKYFIDKAKEKILPDITIAIVSTNFTMRGDIALVDKFTKTRLAMELGVDIVIELPFLGTVSSADYFASNSVASLMKLNITDIAFGVELDDISKLNYLVDVIDSKQWDEAIKMQLAKGYSYSTASIKALSECTSDEELIANFSLPNNTLAIQYLRALKNNNYQANVTLIKRIENNYYDEEISSSIASATSLRNALVQGQNIDLYVPKLPTTYQPINIKKSYHTLFLLLKSRFMLDGIDYVRKVELVDEGIENRFDSMLKNSDNYQSFIDNVQTKRYTKNKIQRIILHIVMNVMAPKGQYYNYLRILGFNKKGKLYIGKLSKEIKSQIITTFKNQTDINSLYELTATKLYGLLTDQESLYLNEYKIPILGD